MKERSFGYVEVDKPEVYRGAVVDIDMFIDEKLTDDIIRHLKYLYLVTGGVQVVKHGAPTILDSASRRLWIYLNPWNITIKKIRFEGMFPFSDLLD